MSRDIRSFFSVISTKKGQSKSSTNINPAKKRAKALDSSDEDVIPESPISTTNSAKNAGAKRRKVINVLSSDSEEDTTKLPLKEPPKIKALNKTKTLRPVNALEAFGSEPVKQSKVPDRPEKPEEVPINKHPKQESKKRGKKQKLQTELGIHNDKDFEKTLLDLDDDLLLENVDQLDKTIDQALEIEPKILSTTQNNKSPTKNGSGSSPKKDSLIINVKDNPKQKAGSSSEDDHKRKTDHYDAYADQEIYEKRRQSGILYQKYLNRSGPAHHGSKELPKGTPRCLQNLCFLRTGVLDSLDNHEFESLVKNHGGRIVHAISRKVNYVVAGEDPGPAKIAKAEEYGTKVLTEDEFLDLIRIKSGMKPLYAKTNEASENSTKTESNSVKEVQRTRDPESLQPESISKSNAVGSETNTKKIKSEISKKVASSSNIPQLKLDCSNAKQSLRAQENLSWTEKHKPTTTKSIIGQQGDKSIMKKLMIWLQNWHKNHTGKNKPKLVKPSPWAKDDDGSYFKAALLSGPPGVGKTTTANLVAKELDFDVVEFNASDTRNKKLLHEEVSQLLSNKSLAGFFTGGHAPTKNHVLLMDEVDGMAGNEDRGGIQELINLIKNSNVPIVCMCNDRNHPKMRSLVNYCLDLRFSRPRLEQIKGAMMGVCFKEGIKISPEALTEVINGAGMDIRQILTHLSVWSAENKILSTETASKEAKSSKKDTILGPWEVCRKVFSEEDHKTMSITDRSRLFFYDYSLAPLFVQDNYLKVTPHAPKKEHLKRFSLAADAISMGDLIDKQIRSSNNWSLLDVEAMYASVLPGHYLEGHVNAQIDFPSWLGKNSKRNKFNRLLSELQNHMRTSISGSKSAVNQDYLTHLRDNIVRPLVQDGVNGVDRALEVMHVYNLLREDLDGIAELALWPKQKDPMNMVESKVKAAFTRAYNKNSAMLPYAIQAGLVKKRAGVGAVDQIGGGLLGEDEEEYNSNSEDEDVTKDAMIKPKKPSNKSSKKETETSRGKGKRGGGASTSQRKGKKSNK